MTDVVQGVCASCRAKGPTVQILETYRYLDSSRYCLKCLRVASIKAGDQYMRDVDAFYDKKMAKLDEKPKVPVIPNLTREQLFNSDPKHPRNLCAVCHKPLPSNYHALTWNIDTLTKLFVRGTDMVPIIANNYYPMFDTHGCKERGINRHLIKPTYYTKIYAEDKDSFEAQKERQFNEEANEGLDHIAYYNAYNALTEDYRRTVAAYDQDKADEKRAEELANMSYDFSTVKITDTKRMEHTHLLAGSGGGKSTLILAQIMADVRRPDPPAIIVVDGKGTLVQTLQRLAILHQNDRLIVLDAADSVQPPSLNMFAPLRRNYDAQTRAQLANKAIQMFGYIFSSTEAKLTPQMNTVFIFLVQLLFTIPDATMQTLLLLLGDKSKSVNDSPFKQYIDRLPIIPRTWFTEDFYHPTEFRETKQKIRNRLFSILNNATFAEMFGASECKFDMFDAIQNRKIVLINAPKPIIGEDAAQLFGRWAIATTLNACFERFTLPRNQWNPAFLIVDEAQEFLDEIKTPELMQQAREFNLGVLLAHQSIKTDLTEQLQATIAANTSIKFAGSVSGQDAGIMARDMRCDAEYIQKQQVTDNIHFACFVRGAMPNAISVSLPIGAISKEPVLSDSAYQAFLQRNRARLYAPPRSEPAPVPQPAKPVSTATPTVTTPKPEPPVIPKISAPKVTRSDPIKQAGDDPGEPSDSW